MIVKHRRGTTLEWQEVNLDLIPEAGELVIEECIDGTRRCKIGTGYTRFSELPYIDDKTRADLLSEIASAKKECKNSISDINTSFLEELGILEAELKSIETKCYELEKDYIIRDADTRAILEKNFEDAAKHLNNGVAAISKTASDTRTVLQNEIARVENRLVSTENQFKADLEKCIDDLEIQLVDQTKDYIKKDDEVKATLTRNLAGAVSTLTTDYTSKYNEVKSDIDELDSRVSSNTAKIAAATKRINSLVVTNTESSLTSDAEVIDIRTGYDGEKYDTAGDAVRAIGYDLLDLDNNVKSLRNSLSQYIDSQAVDGLHYDKEGAVGLGQPYYLYLTSDGNIIQDSGVQIIGGAGGGPGGGGSSSLKISFLPGESAEIKTVAGAKVVIGFVFDGEDSSGDAILSASATWRIDGVVAEYGTVKSGENYFDATKYIRTGTTKVHLTVNDDNGSAVTKSWTVQSVELAVASDFNDKRKYPESGKEKVIFDFKPTGAVRKTAIFKLDGAELPSMVIEKDVSGTPVSYELPVMTHGSHLLEVYLEADINDTTVKTDSIYKDIIWYDTTREEPVIGAAFKDLEVKQYATTNIVYTVYDPKNDIPTVDIEVDGTIVSTQVVQLNKDYNNTPTAVYPYIATTPGKHTIKLICGVTEKIISVDAESINVNIAPVTVGLAFDFNPVGRNNLDVNNRLWSYNNVHMSVSDNFDWINGGYISNDPDGPCFCIKAGSTATIDYKLFANEARVSGKEVKLVFKTKNVANPDAVFASCIDNTTDRDHVGVKMGVHGAAIYGKDVKLELAYSEEDVIEFEFNISRDSEAIPMIMGYEDGVPTRPVVYNTTTSSFQQNSAKFITLGSPDCDLYIYRFKVYDVSLSASEILRNFIADARTSEEMIDRYNRNQIYDENQNLTAEALAEKCPWLRIYKLSAPHFTNNKSDKVPNTTIQQIYLAGDKKLDNWVCYNAQHSGQGTSSNNYGAAGRNLDFIMNKSGSYIMLGDETRAVDDKITLTRSSIPTNYLNAKVNIASSNNLTNAILANRYNKFNPYERPFVDSQLVSTGEKDKDGNDIKIKPKDTMEFHNCVIFIQETDPDLTTHREFADTDWHFYAIGNIGDSKKTDKTRLTDPEDPYECCVEIMDVGLPLSAFPRETIREAMAFELDDSGNRKYKWATEDNFTKGILLEKTDEGTYVPATGDHIDVENKTYYIDFLLNDDFSEDYTYGWRYISDDEDEEVVNTCKQAWIDFYRFVTTSTNEEFKANLKDYFVVDSALYYYLFTTRYCMVDNRAKNTFWHYGKTADGTRKWDLCWDYDNDTSLGLNNFGKQVYRYGLEDIDYDEENKEVFRQSNSLFFCRIRDLFASELKQMYNTLESADAWNANVLINEGDAWQNEFPEELWRVDIERKYIRTYNKSFINGQGDKQFLNNMANGKMKYHRRQWERNQEQYMASKYQTPTAMDAGKGAVNFRVNQFTSIDGSSVNLPNPAPNYEFKLTPYSYMYLNVKYGGAAPVSVRVTQPNVETAVPFAGQLDADIINIGSAASIRDFGDLSLIYAETASMQNATRVKKLKLGNNDPDYDNNSFSLLETGENALLEELDLTNISGLESTQDFRQLINLKKLYAFGTNIPSITFAQGGKLEYTELPALTTLILNGLKYLTDANLKLTGVTDDNGALTYPSIVDLTVEDCPYINVLNLLEACPNVINVKLNNIDFGTKTYEYFEENIFKLRGFEGETSNAKLTGNVRFESLTGEQFNEIRTRYPNLIIAYDALTSVIKFMDTDKATELSTRTESRNSENKINCTELGIVPNAVTEKVASSEFSYELFGWSTTADIVVNYELLGANAEELDRKKYNEKMLTDIEGDRVFYPVFKAIRRSYTVQFIGADSEVLKKLSIPYGSIVPEEEYSNLLMKDTTDYDAPGIYKFTGWEPMPENTQIKDNTEFYAQFAEDEFGLADIEYTLGSSTLSITKCKNTFNDAIKIPSNYTVNGKDYIVTSLGGFDYYSSLKQITLPDSLIALTSEAFYYCTGLESIEIPTRVTTIASRSFAHCENLATVILPTDLVKLDATCFAWCYKLANVNLEELTKLTTINSYVFAECMLSNVILADTVTYIGALAFGGIRSLSNITINSTKLCDLEKFSYQAFAGSGSEENPLIINVPWTEEEHYSTFGGTDSNGVYHEVQVATSSLTQEPIYGDGKFGAAYAKVICTDTPKEEVTN